MPIFGTPPGDPPPAVQSLVFTGSTLLSSGIVNSIHSTQLDSTGGVRPYEWITLGGELPSGLSMNSSGLISGTPTSTGTSTFTIQCRDAQNSTIRVGLRIDVFSTAINTLTFTGDTSMPAASTGVAYSQHIRSTGGVPRYTYSTTGNTDLPTGLTLGSTGLITGTASDTATSTFSIEVTDSTGSTLTGQFSLNVITPSLTLEPDLPSTSSDPGDNYFDRHAPTAFRVFSGRDQYSINRWSMANPGNIDNGNITSTGDVVDNPEVRYVSSVGGACLKAQSSGGLGGLADLVPRVRFDEPGGNRYLVTWNVRYSSHWLEWCNRDDESSRFPERPWRDSKTQHFRGKDAIEPDADGQMKINLGFRRATQRVSSHHLARFFGETRGGFAGPSMSSWAPIGPSSFATFELYVNKWIQLWCLFEEGDPITDYGSYSVWIADEDNDPQQVITSLDWRVPWSPDEADPRGVVYLQLFANPKPDQESTTPESSACCIFWKNLMVIKNPPADVSSLLLRPGDTSWS